MNIGLLGFGVVGRGVYDMLAGRDDIRAAWVLCRRDLGELEKQLHPDNLHVTENISIVAAVGRKMAFRPGTSGRIFAALGEHDINIRMISQGPDELNIIVGVDTKDFAPAIQVLYNSFVK